MTGKTLNCSSLSKRVHAQRKYLVDTERASWYLPYKPVYQAIDEAGIP